jgi:hypothetical protein
MDDIGCYLYSEELEETLEVLWKTKGVDADR